MAWFKRSPWVLHYNATSCNGCDTEVIVSLTPLYDVERFGVINTGNPKHADILLATGSVNEKSVQVLKTLYDQMPNPRQWSRWGYAPYQDVSFRIATMSWEAWIRLCRWTSMCRGVPRGPRRS